VRNRFSIVCQYCDYRWEVNYAPKEEARCLVCKDNNIRVIDLFQSKVDYYVGCPPFKDNEEDGKVNRDSEVEKWFF
jgi:hypothetical protein